MRNKRKGEKFIMTKLDRMAYRDWKIMEGLMNEGLGKEDIAELMNKTVSYLITLESYFA